MLCQSLGWMSCYVRTSRDDFEPKDSSKIGWHSQRDSKLELLQTYGDLLSQRELIETDERVIDELGSFLRADDGEITLESRAADKRMDREPNGDLAIAAIQYVLLQTEVRDGLTASERAEKVRREEAKRTPWTGSKLSSSST